MNKQAYVVIIRDISNGSELVHSIHETEASASLARDIILDEGASRSKRYDITWEPLPLENNVPRSLNKVNAKVAEIESKLSKKKERK